MKSRAPAKMRREIASPLFRSILAWVFEGLDDALTGNGFQSRLGGRIGEVFSLVNSSNFCLTSGNRSRRPA